MAQLSNTSHHHPSSPKIKNEFFYDLTIFLSHQSCVFQRQKSKKTKDEWMPSSQPICLRGSFGLYTGLHFNSITIWNIIYHKYGLNVEIMIQTQKVCGIKKFRIHPKRAKQCHGLLKLLRSTIACLRRSKISRHHRPPRKHLTTTTVFWNTIFFASKDHHF